MQIISIKYPWLLIKILDIVEKLQKNLGCIPTKLLISQLLVAQSYQTWLWIDAKTHSFYPLVHRESNLILIFMIIKENIRNHRKIAEKIKGVYLHSN